MFIFLDLSMFEKILPKISFSAVSTLIATISIYFCGHSLALESQVIYSPHIEVSLVSEDSHLIPGQTHRFALKLQPDEGWHTYWKNPGDTGQPTQLKWDVPKGFIVGEIEWPIPERIEYREVVNFGYHGTKLLPVSLSVPSDIDADIINLKVNASWLVCAEICIPGEATLDISLPVLNSGHIKKTSGVIKNLKKDFPKLIYSDAAYFTNGENIEITLPIDILPDTNLEPEVFIGIDGIVDNKSFAVLDVINENIVISLKPDSYMTTPPSFLPITLVYDKSIAEEFRAYEVSAAYREINSIPSENRILSNSMITQHNIFNIIFLAFLAGIILNAMPCVFPVLSLKIFSLIDNGLQTRKNRYQQGIAYTSGIIFSFILLALILISLKAAGEQIGWGFQLQQPLFIAILVYVVFVLALSMSGFVEFSGSFQNIGNKLIANSSGWRSSFFTGMLATLVATPCTAPFMGVAIAYSLSQSMLVSLIIFSVMGFGLALPFLLVALIPSFSKILPKPGQWMVSLKQFLAFPLYVTVVWLLWVFSKQTSIDSASLLLLGIVTISLSIWFWMLSNSSEKKKIKFLSIIAFFVSIFIALKSTNISDENSITTNLNINDGYEVFSQDLLDHYLKNNEKVFVNMTADWCITCKLNERVALSTRRVKNIFEKNEIRYLVGDWTNSNPLITEYLNKFDREGVPLYTYYTETGDVIVLPQLLTPGIIERSVEFD